MSMNDVWAIMVSFVGAWIATFLGFEFYALAKGKMPLTGWIRSKLGIDPVLPKHRWTAPMFAIVLFGFVIWFVPHIEEWINW